MYEKVKTMKKACGRLAVLSGVALLAGGTCAGDLWSDCAAWYVGADDKNGSGYYDSGELVDIRHATDVTVNNGGTRGLDRNNIEIRTEDVECAVLGRTLASQKVLYFNGTATTNDPGKAVNPPTADAEKAMGILVNGNYIQLPDIITGDVYTAIIRFKPDENHPWTTSYNNFLNLGFHMSKKQGFMLGLSDNPAYNRPSVCIGPKAYLQPFAANLCLTNAVFTKRSCTWHELAFVVSKPSADKCKIRAALFRPGWKAVENKGNAGHEQWSEKVLSISDSGSDGTIQYPQPIAGGLRIGGESNSDKTQFRGKIHMLALWNRALTDNEVRAAFGTPNPGVFRVGFPGQDGSKFFASSVGEQTTVTPEPENWHKAPATLERGKAFTINFTLQEWQKGINQILKFTPYSGSGTISVELDGELVADETAVTSGVMTHVAIRGRRLKTAGAHALTIRRTDSGANDLVLSCIELAGSWQRGLDDKSWSDMNSAGATTGDFYDVEGNLMHFRRVILGNYQQNVHFTVPADMVSYPSRFVWKTTGSNANKKTRFLLNGTEVYNENVVDGAEHQVEIPAGTLNAGENILRMEDSSGTSGYYGMDFLRYEVVLQSGLAIILR